ADVLLQCLRYKASHQYVVHYKLSGKKSVMASSSLESAGLLLGLCWLFLYI
mgnify:CR=1